MLTHHFLWKIIHLTDTHPFISAGTMKIQTEVCILEKDENALLYRLQTNSIYI